MFEILFPQESASDVLFCKLILANYTLFKIYGNFERLK